MTDWLTQDLFATVIALGAAVTVVRRVAEFAAPGKAGAGGPCASCGTPGKTCATTASQPAAIRLETPLIQISQISRRAS
jgi:hypothetical protein